MARTVATLPVGNRITDFISLGVIAKTFPVDKVHAILRATGKTSVRQRDLPAHVVVYYVVALALYMQSSYRACSRAFYAWPIGISSASDSGTMPAAQAPTCCGGSRRAAVLFATRNCLTALI